MIARLRGNRATPETTQPQPQLRLVADRRIRTRTRSTLPASRSAVLVQDHARQGLEGLRHLLHMTGVPEGPKGRGRKGPQKGRLPSARRTPKDMNRAIEGIFRETLEDLGENSRMNSWSDVRSDMRSRKGLARYAIRTPDDD